MISKIVSVKQIKEEEKKKLSQSLSDEILVWFSPDIQYVLCFMYFGILGGGERAFRWKFSRCISVYAKKKKVENELPLWTM